MMADMDDRTDTIIRVLILVLAVVVPKYYPMETISVLLALILLNIVRWPRQ